MSVTAVGLEGERHWPGAVEFNPFLSQSLITPFKYDCCKLSNKHPGGQFVSIMFAALAQEDPGELGDCAQAGRQSREPDRTHHLQGLE